MKILHLTLKKVWYDKILSGEKKEEYREIKQYWVDRLGMRMRYLTTQIILGTMMSFNSLTDTASIDHLF